MGSTYYNYIKKKNQFKACFKLLLTQENYTFSVWVFGEIDDYTIH